MLDTLRHSACMGSLDETMNACQLVGLHGTDVDCAPLAAQCYEETAGLCVGDVVTRTKKVSSCSACI